MFAYFGTIDNGVFECGRLGCFHGSFIVVFQRFGGLFFLKLSGRFGLC